MESQYMNVSILGCGVMGAGIVQVLVNKDYIETVYWWGRNKQSVENALKALRLKLAKQLKREKQPPTKLEEIMNKIVICNDFFHISSCEVVIEAIKENSDAKISLFESIAKFLSDDCLVATNTSSISITELSISVPYPEMFVGMHFFNPPSILKLVEVVKGLLTSDLALEKGIDFVNKIHKEAIIVNDSPGFIVNRMLIPMINEAVCILSENIAAKEYIDKAMKLGANHPLGPLALADLIGLDVCLSIMDTLHKEFGDQKFRASRLLRQYVSAGMLGRKTKLGFYKY